MEFKYQLEKYKGTATRHTCPGCGKPHQFSRYVDESGAPIAEEVGICNRVDKCGYVLTPSQYFKNNKLTVPLMLSKPHDEQKKSLFTISIKSMADTLCNYPNNSFALCLLNRFGEESAINLLTHYQCIGTSQKYPGACIYWQIDRFGKVRTGKIMKYHVETFKRDKTFTTWAHTSLINTNTHELKQVFFGEHLLTLHPKKQIAIVEAEKSAVICAQYMPEYNWLAAGNINGLTAEKLKALQGKEAILFPDLGKGYEVWEKKAYEFKNISKLKLSNFLLNNATPEDTEKGHDIADFLLKTNN